MTTKMLLVGCGKMGSAMLQGWLEAGAEATSVAIIERADQIQALQDRFPGVTVLSTLDELGSDIQLETVVLAVKPQILAETAPSYARLRTEQTLFISVAAGKTLSFFQQHLGANSPVVRAMPNTPASIGRGMTVLTASDTVTDAQKAHATRLLKAVGQVAWIADEADMDAVTALSGSGPAYIFHMVEAMAAAGVNAGLSTELALQLARATVAGAGALLDASEDSASQLRKNVTSPGGTTAAGLTILMDEQDGLTRLMMETIEAAKRRSIDLA